MEEYTLAHVCAAAGLKPRTVQVWTDAHVLEPLQGTDRQGRGVHRRYPFDEMLVACVIAQHDRMHAPLGQLVDLARRIRATLDFRDAPNGPTLREKFLESMHSGAKHVLAYRITIYGDGAFGGAVEVVPLSKLEPPEPGEIVHLVPLSQAFAGLARLR